MLLFYNHDEIYVQRFNNIMLGRLNLINNRMLTKSTKIDLRFYKKRFINFLFVN